MECLGYLDELSSENKIILNSKPELSPEEAVSA